MLTPTTQTDLYTLYLGDCLDILKEMPDKSVDCVITDPPYNVGLEYSDGDNRIDYPEWCARWFSHLVRIATFIVFTPGLVNLSMWAKITEPLWYGSWRKSNQNSPSRLGGFNAWEPILFYGKPLKRIGHDAWDMPIGLQSDVGDHPCPKFLPFWRKLLDDVTPPRTQILDPFMGSGTSGVACMQLGERHFLGIEKDDKYYALSERRISEAQLPLL